MSKINSLMNDIKEVFAHYDIISISHNDLDGYGCTMALKAGYIANIMQYYHNISDFNLSTLMMEMKNIMCYNTAYMSKNPREDTNNSTYNTIEDALEYYKDCHTCEPYEHKLAIFITDLANIYISEIYNILNKFDFTNTEIKVFIIDHHHSVYVDDENNEETINIKSSAIEYKDGAFNNEYLDASPIEYTYINCVTNNISIHNIISYDISATHLISYIYFEMLYSGIKFFDDILTILYRCTYHISKYDTGHWGAWKYDKLEDKNPEPDIMLYLWWRTSMDNSGSGLNTSGMYDFSINLLRGVVGMALGIPVDYPRTRCYNKLKFINDEYSNFVDKFHIVKSIHRRSGNLLIINGIEINIPDEYTESGFIIAYPDKDAKFNYGIPYALFAKQFLEDHQDVDVLMTVNSKYHSATLYSRKDGLDVSKIAVANGGGGHSCAAGFPYTVKYSKSTFQKSRVW